MEAGYGVRRIQIMMGHTALSSTLIYLHVTQSGLAKITSPLDLPELDEEEESDDKSKD
ncbi:MAG: hypothetical protein KKF30_13425 [Proteobacteria bacterium]|nr:hypothetical protein [Pseudomonadota bacterium]MBU4468928.1 hypothetical protein [Pseudomonadota bacterium]